MKISVIIPVFNEEGNISKLLSELKSVLSRLDHQYEIIAVNDASTDGSLQALRAAAEADRRVRVISFKFNSGQTAAMSAGIKHSIGEIVIPMDADLQNDPNDIPRLVDKMGEGYDVVSGWRRDRKDDLIKNRVPSIIANWIIRKITGVPIHDSGCSMKAYKGDMIREVDLYGEMHRFIPAYMAWHGGKVAEIVVNHRPRASGKSKYNVFKTFRVVLDLIVVKFLSKYMNRPVHFFGGIGFVSLALGILAGLAAIILKLFRLRDFVATPLPVFSALLVIVGVQLAVMGVIAEMIMRVYYESRDATPYKIAEKINF